jgi:hypothetical protein
MRRQRIGHRSTALLLVIATLSSASPARAQDAGLPPWRAAWRAAAEPDLGAVVAPIDLARAPDGSLVVVDRELRRVQRFDARGKVLGVYRPPEPS